MANTTVQTGAVPAPLSLPARFLGVITAPRATFESIVAHPKWFGMLAVCAIGMAVLVGGFLATSVGQEAWLDAALNGPFSQSSVSDQQIQAMERMAPYMGYVTAGYMLIMMPIFTLIIAAILWVIFNAVLGGNGTFKQVFTVLTHAGPIGILSQLFTMPLNYARGTMSSSTNLGVLFQFVDETSFAGRLLGMVDLFVIWQLIVISIGLAVLYKRRTQPIATTFFVLYAIIAVVVAYVRRGGA